MKKMIIDERTINMTLISGRIRELTSSEKNIYKGYNYVVVEPHTLYIGEKSLSVPKGFLTDGSSGGPSYGRSWLFHDWLYSHHYFDDGTECVREEADLVMSSILYFEQMRFYYRAFVFMAKLNPFYVFSKAWRISGTRGPEYIK